MFDTCIMIKVNNDSTINNNGTYSVALQDNVIINIEQNMDQIGELRVMFC